MRNLSWLVVAIISAIIYAAILQALKPVITTWEHVFVVCLVSSFLLGSMLIAYEVNKK